MKEIIVAYDENTEASPVMGDWVGELVRCKDCRFGEKENDLYRCWAKHGRCSLHNPDWFCADGVKKYG